MAKAGRRYQVPEKAKIRMRREEGPLDAALSSSKPELVLPLDRATLSSIPSIEDNGQRA
jgi:hypothetical protein